MRNTSWYNAVSAKKQLLLLRSLSPLSFWFHCCVIVATEGMTFHQWKFYKEMNIGRFVNSKPDSVKHSLCPHVIVCKCYLSSHLSLPLPHTTAHFKSPSLHNLALWIVFYSNDHLTFVFELTQRWFKKSTLVKSLVLDQSKYDSNARKINSYLICLMKGP